MFLEFRMQPFRFSDCFLWCVCVRNRYDWKMKVSAQPCKATLWCGFSFANAHDPKRATVVLQTGQPLLPRRSNFRKILWRQRNKRDFFIFEPFLVFVLAAHPHSLTEDLPFNFMFPCLPFTFAPSIGQCCSLICKGLNTMETYILDGRTPSSAHALVWRFVLASPPMAPSRSSFPNVNAAHSEDLFCYYLALTLSSHPSFPPGICHKRCNTFPWRWLSWGNDTPEMRQQHCTCRDCCCGNNLSFFIPEIGKLGGRYNMKTFIESRLVVSLCSQK